MKLVISRIGNIIEKSEVLSGERRRSVKDDNCAGHCDQQHPNDVLNNNEGTTSQTTPWPLRQSLNSIKQGGSVPHILFCWDGKTYGPDKHHNA